MMSEMLRAVIYRPMVEPLGKFRPSMSLDICLDYLMLLVLGMTPNVMEEMLEKVQVLWGVDPGSIQGTIDLLQMQCITSMDVIGMQRGREYRSYNFVKFCNDQTDVQQHEEHENKVVMAHGAAMSACS